MKTKRGVHGEVPARRRGLSPGAGNPQRVLGVTRRTGLVARKRLPSGAVLEISSGASSELDVAVLGGAGAAHFMGLATPRNGWLCAHSTLFSLSLLERAGLKRVWPPPDTPGPKPIMLMTGAVSHLGPQPPGGAIPACPCRLMPQTRVEQLVLS